MEKILERIGKDRLIAIMRENKADQAFNAAIATIEGGIKIVEITMNTPDAVSIIRDLSAKYPNILIGAGTVLDINLADQAIEAGAKFLVAPHTDIELINYTVSRNILFSPGTSTPTEIINAHKAGAKLIKVFPIDTLGGASFIRSVRGPIPHVKLMPTGGVNINNIKDFFKAGVFAVGISRALVAKEAVESGDYCMIKRMTQELIKKSMLL